MKLNKNNVHVQQHIVSPLTHNSKVGEGQGIFYQKKWNGFFH